MSWPGDNRIVYHPLVVAHDMKSFDSLSAKRIKKAIEQKLITYPELYGAPLRGTLKQYWKLRVGDWRLVYAIKHHVVYIIVIAHRKGAYGLATRRLG